MLSSCTLVSCTPSQKGFSHISQPVLKELGTKAKRGGVQPPKFCPPKSFTALGSPGASWGHGDSPGHSSERFSSTYETRQTRDTQIKSPPTEGDTQITSDRARGCGGVPREGTGGHWHLSARSCCCRARGGEEGRAGCPWKDRGVPRRTGVSLQGPATPRPRGTGAASPALFNK